MSSSSLVFIILIWFFVEPNNSVLVGPVDLTWEYDSTTVTWPGTAPFEIIRRVRTETYESWTAWSDLRSSEHAGTHLDAPFLFSKPGVKTAEIPLRSLISAGAVIDVSEEVGTNQEFFLQPDHLDEWVQTNGPFANQTILLVRFGWSKYYHDQDLFLGKTKAGSLHFPGISTEAAEWIVSNGNIVGVGTDTLSVTGGHNADVNGYTVLNERGLFELMQVKMLDPLPARGITLIVMPMKIVEGTLAPCRVVAVPNGFL